MSRADSASTEIGVFLGLSARRLNSGGNKKTHREATGHLFISIVHNHITMVQSTRFLADIDTDHDVGGADSALLADDHNRAACSEASPCSGDVNGDGVVNTDDLGILALEFGRTSCPDHKFYYFHNDHPGTPQWITDRDSTVVWSADYKPFGEATFTTNTISDPFRFPGQYYENETGLHNNYFRYYDPGMARYSKADPKGLIVGENIFSMSQIIRLI